MSNGSTLKFKLNVVKSIRVLSPHLRVKSQLQAKRIDASKRFYTLSSNYTQQNCCYAIFDFGILIAAGKSCNG